MIQSLPNSWWRCYMMKARRIFQIISEADNGIEALHVWSSGGGSLSVMCSVDISFFSPLGGWRSEGERDILRMMADGFQNRQISSRYSIRTIFRTRLFR
jgi:hypothetical protein